MRLANYLLMIGLMSFTWGGVQAGDYLRTSGNGSGTTEFNAVKQAYGNMVLDVVRRIAGDQGGRRGVVGMALKEEFAKDPEMFIRDYFQDEYRNCGAEDGRFECLVEATAKLMEFRPAVRDALINPNEGKQRIDHQKIAILRDPEHDIVRRLADAVQSGLLRYGHQVQLLRQDAPTGKAGNECDGYRSELKKWGKFPRARKQLQAKLKACAKNLDIARSIEIRPPQITRSQYSARTQALPGRMIMDLEIRNGATGEIDLNINDSSIKADGLGGSEEAAMRDLNAKLIKRAAGYIVRRINESLAQEARSKRSRKTKVARLENQFEYFYAVEIHGISQEGAADRRKVKMVRNVIKATGAKPERDNQYSRDLKQVYRFGVHQPLDEEDLLDAFYNAAEQAGHKSFRARVDGEGRFVVSF